MLFIDGCLVALCCVLVYFGLWVVVEYFVFVEHDGAVGDVVGEVELMCCEQHGCVVRLGFEQ